MKLTAGTILVCASDWSVFGHTGQVMVRTAQGLEVALGPHGLLILDAFSEPRTVTDAVRRNGVLLSGTQAWIEMTSTIHRFVEAGLLKRLDGGEASPAPSRGFGGPSIHIEMLNDEGRTSAFLRAIADVVQPGDVVVDLGTGTGVLAMAAARAGAARVYAIEESAIADVALQAFRDNGFGESITLLQGHSTRIELPERADLLVSELIGHHPLAEQVCEYTRDAVARYLKPNARLLPSALVVHAAAVQARPADLSGIRARTADLRRWRRAYGFDLSALARHGQTPGHCIQMPSARLARWRRLSRVCDLLRIDFRCGERVGDRLVGELDFEEAGRFDAITVWFTATLAPGHVLSTDPAFPRRDNHWWHATWFTGRPIDVNPGERWYFEITPSGNEPLVLAKRA